MRRRRLCQAFVLGALAIVSTATAGGGSMSAGGKPPLNVTPPSISGAAVDGQALTADPGRWRGGVRAYSVQWQRCDSSGAACSAIALAKGKSYVLVAADVGKTLRVTVVATNKSGSTAATSLPTLVVASAPTAAGTTTSTQTTMTTSTTAPSNTTSPQISGTSQQGQVLTASPGIWSGTTPIGYAYQWKRCDAAGASCVAISGATNTSYIPTSADVSWTIRVFITANNSAGSATASSNATVIVASPPSGRVFYSKTGEGTANVFATDSLSEGCYPDLPPWNGLIDYCYWAKVTQFDPPECGPFKDTTDPFAGQYSIRYDVAAAGATTERCEVSKPRRGDAYTHDWYHVAVKHEASYNEANQGGALINQFNYNSVCAAPLYLSMEDDNDSMYLLLSAGAQTPGTTVCSFYSGQPGWPRRPENFPGPIYVMPPGTYVKGQWHEVLLHVYWTPLNEGVIEAWYRRRGGTWDKRVDYGPVGSGRHVEYNFPTMSIGQQQVPQGCTTVTVANINDDCHWPNVDKMGQYQNSTTSTDGVPSMWGEFCRASSREAAEACLG